MSGIARENKVNIRPHIKTHKLPYIAKEQLASGAIGITVAKISEAEVMADNGIQNIFIAYPIVTKEKIQKAIELSKRVKLILGVDSLVGAKRLSELAVENNITLEIRLEVDSGLERTGIPYENVKDIAKEISTYRNLEISGIYTFRGPVLNGSPTLNFVEAGIEEGEMMVKLADQLRKAGLSIDDVSVGSTSTSASAATVPGVTEIRPGTYVFYDAMQEKYGCCTEEECAAVVKVTVISRPTKNRAIIDGGSKTFATDVQPNQAPIYLKGFGKVVGHPNIILERLTEEHGMLHIEGDSPIEVGDTLEIIPNHICTTINLHNFIFMKEKDNTFERYEVLARGKLQ
ncbi:amino acid aldolase [Oceanobacillus arenosus]|uniref:Amino acid aldolase n=2 Tax=Oceanobacillus arenosus TaxID=1229153 RepID=A0A3D8Q320_9BACI|nr:amino acid aldolase [Oceanobacillus arenosus]